MSLEDTTRLELPLLQPAQAQKHVTVNEALMRLDGLVNLVLESATQEAPPAGVVDGQCWAVPAGASGDWQGQGGSIAIGANGGWVFVPARDGMRGFIRDQGVEAICLNGVWMGGVLSLGAMGSGMAAGMAEAEVTVGVGASFDTGVTIPDGVIVLGAVARVTEALSGTLTSWQLGHADATNRFGAGLGTAAGSWARGLLGSPTAYYSPANLVMTAEGGDFAGGKLRLAVHWLELRLPDL